MKKKRFFWFIGGFALFGAWLICFGQSNEPIGITQRRYNCQLTPGGTPTICITRIVVVADTPLPVFIAQLANTSTPTFTPTGSATPTITPTPTVTPTLTPISISQPVTVVGNFAYQSAPVAPNVVLVGGQSPNNNNVQPLPLDNGGNNLQVVASQGTSPWIVSVATPFPNSSEFGPVTFTTTGTSSAFGPLKPCGDKFALVTTTTGTITTFTVQIEPSRDGSNFDNSSSHALVSGTGNTFSGTDYFSPAAYSGDCVPYVRLDCTTLTLGVGTNIICYVEVSP